MLHEDRFQNHKSRFPLESYLKGYRIIERRQRSGTIDVADRIYLINLQVENEILQVENEIHLLEVLNLQKVSVSVAKADQANHHGDHHGRDHHGFSRPLWLQLQVLRGNREDSMGGA